MNERLNTNNRPEQFKVEILREADEWDDFVFPHFDFMDTIHNKLIWIDHIFRDTPYVYEVSCFIIGFVFFTFPLYYFIHNTYSQLTIQNIVLGNINLSSTLSLSIISNYIVLVYIIGVFILKLMDVLLIPNFMNWNLRTMGCLFQYFILVLCFQSFLRCLKEVFHLIDVFIHNEFTAVATQYTDNWLALIQYLRAIQLKSNSIEDNLLSALLYPLEIFTYFYLVRLALFKTNHSLSYLIMSLSFLFMVHYSNLLFGGPEEEISFNSIQHYFKCITLFLCCYLFYLCECIQKKVIETKKPNRKCLIVLNGIIVLGIALVIISCLKVIKYDISKLFQRIDSIGYSIESGLFIILIGNCYYVGSLLINFIFYSIEKQFFVYRNNKYEKYIKVAQCVPFDQSPYNK